MAVFLTVACGKDEGSKGGTPGGGVHYIQHGMPQTGVHPVNWGFFTGAQLAEIKAIYQNSISQRQGVPKELLIGIPKQQIPSITQGNNYITNANGLGGTNFSQYSTNDIIPLVVVIDTSHHNTMGMPTVRDRFIRDFRSTYNIDQNALFFVPLEHANIEILVRRYDIQQQGQTGPYYYQGEHNINLMMQIAQRHGVSIMQNYAGNIEAVAPRARIDAFHHELMPHMSLQILNDYTF